MSDYERIAKAIFYITERVQQQPTLDAVSAHLNMSSYHFQRLFSRWAGVTPKRFLQILTVERAKQLLSESRPVLEVSESLGLSSGSRLYDHFVSLEAVTPGEFKKGGQGVLINYATHNSPFGKVFIAMTTKGICKLAFLEQETAGEHLQVLKKCWPGAKITENSASTKYAIEEMFSGKIKKDRPLSIHVAGTNFQLSVWKALLAIPPGTVTSYNHIASQVGRPRAARAVGTALGSNPVAFLIPCHRVLRQSGELGGYHWGETRKHAIHAWESAIYE